ncbi:fumarylacetoacetate hydrolase family protein [Marihabitans asiaticum]|uniref:2-keto-4-pentenoate hydratase n=1 Tax=Marihabitans asiaticum TaxID=415218 RepID=A0A560WFY0_9MICO|nr:2-keto-4-pentenoate hydratase [Marihabitans asiaticum]TWD16603.1 2-keto-4-pentenoate hydratase [Marihabitans asiaticum]
MGQASQTLQDAAAALLAAYESGTATPPLTETYDDLGVADAYAIQLEQVRSWTAAGRTVVGHKVGLTSAQVQKQLGVDTPDFGHLMDDFAYLEHDPIPVGRFLQPKVEPEIAFVLGKPLQGPGVTLTQAIDAVDYVLPAIEIVDSRIADWRITLVDTVADNASSGAYVLGSTPTRLEDVDLRLTGCVFTRNSQIVGTGAGGAVLGSPISSLVWLANTVGALGTSLDAGHVVLPGSVTPMSPVAAGDSFTATFAGIGSVTARFAS